MAPKKRTRKEKSQPEQGSVGKRLRTEKDQAASRKSSNKHNHSDIEKTREGWRRSSKAHRARKALERANAQIENSKGIEPGVEEQAPSKRMPVEPAHGADEHLDMSVGDLKDVMEALIENVSLERLRLDGVMDLESRLDVQIEARCDAVMRSATREVKEELRIQRVLEKSRMALDDCIGLGAEAI